MKRIVFLSILFFLSIACSTTNNDQVNDLTAGTNDAGSATDMPKLTIDDFDVTAGAYVNKEIEISGIVDHVCKHSGKKLKLVSSDGASVHVDSETRFDDALVGNEISLKGIVKEQRIDESYCLQMEEDNIKNHKEGATNEEQFSHQQQLIQQYRDSMAVAGVDHLSFYTLEFVAIDKKSE